MCRTAIAVVVLAAGIACTPPARGDGPVRSAGAGTAVPPAASGSSTVPGRAGAMPLFDLTADTARIFAPRWPERDGSCLVYRDYVVIAWGSPDPRPVAIVRARDPGGDPAAADCTADSMPGDFVVWNEWAEYFCGMWRDLLFIDSGTGDIRSLILYDVPSRRRVLELDGAGETAGWMDDVTLRVWLLRGTDLPRSLCPDIPEVLGVGVDSLFALNLQTLRLEPLGPWRCHSLQ